MFIPFCHDELVIATPVTDHYLALQGQRNTRCFHDFLKDPIILRKRVRYKKEMDLFLGAQASQQSNLKCDCPHEMTWKASKVHC